MLIRVPRNEQHTVTMLLFFLPGGVEHHVKVDNSHRIFDYKLPEGVTEDDVEIYSVFLGRDQLPALGCGPVCIKRATPKAAEPAPAVDVAPTAEAAPVVVAAPAVEPAIEPAAEPAPAAESTPAVEPTAAEPAPAAESAPAIEPTAAEPAPADEPVEVTPIADEPAEVTPVAVEPKHHRRKHG